MKPMIVSLRGCSGAGKSTVATSIMNTFPTQTILDASNKIYGYKVDIPNKQYPVFIIGKYNTPCGGCDSISTQQEIVDRVTACYNQGGNVLFESLLASGGYGTVGKLSEDIPEYTFATLDTPLDVCLERVKQRRAAKGNHEPLNPKNTESKFGSTRNVMKKMLADPTKKAVWIDHTNAVAEVLGLFV